MEINFVFTRVNCNDQGQQLTAFKNIKYAQLYALKDIKICKKKIKFAKKLKKYA